MYVVSIAAFELIKCTSVIVAGGLKREQHLFQFYITQKGNRKMKLDIVAFFRRFSPLKTGNITSANWWRPGDGQAHDDVQTRTKVDFFFQTKQIKAKTSK